MIAVKIFNYKIPPILPLPKGGNLPLLLKAPTFGWQRGVRGDFFVAKRTEGKKGLKIFSSAPSELRSNTYYSSFLILLNASSMIFGSGRNVVLK